MIWQDEIRSATDFHREFGRLPTTLAVLRRAEAGVRRAADRSPQEDARAGWQQVARVAD